MPFSKDLGIAIQMGTGLCWAMPAGRSGSFIGEWIDQIVDDKEEDLVGRVNKIKWYYKCFMWNTIV